MGQILLLCRYYVDDQNEFFLALLFSKDFPLKTGFRLSKPPAPWLIIAIKKQETGKITEVCVNSLFSVCRFGVFRQIKGKKFHLKEYYLSVFNKPNNCINNRISQKCEIKGGFTMCIFNAVTWANTEIRLKYKFKNYWKLLNDFGNVKACIISCII